MRALLALVLLTTVAHAEPQDELTFGSQLRALRASSAQALTSDDYVGGQLVYGRRLVLAIPLASDVQWWGTAAFGWGGATGEMFQTLTTDISAYVFTVGGHARYAPYSHLALSAGLDVGSQHAALTLTDHNGRTASDGGWGVLAKLSIAADLLAYDGPGFSFGLRAELGYVKASGVALTPTSPHDDSTLSIAMTSASIGHLDLGGPTFGIGAIARF